MGGLFGGGGGGSAPAPVTQQVNNTSIPSYAQPYVENMLGKAEALTDINQNPYQTYQGQRIADFSPLQQQVMGNVANQQVASQNRPATDLATMSGLGSLSTANRMGNLGNQYQRQATSMTGPGSIGDYMNPYIAQSLEPQLRQLQQQYGIQGAAQQGAATQAGAFGGSRNALMQGLNQQNQMLAQQQAIGQGYNTAFQNAQQAQQFGANLGLQGLQGKLAGYGQAGQAAGTLGQLGQTQFGQQQAINAAQQQVGAVQQAQAQQGLDVAYQNYLAQKNYPYQQLGYMSDMVRGLPLSQTSQSMYQAPANLGSQLGGLGMTALGIYGMSGGFKGGAATGGQVKGLKAGGQIGYFSGGEIQMMSTEQLMKLLDNPELTPMEADQIQEQLMLRKRMENNPETSKIMGMNNQPVGLDSIPTGDTVPPEGLAGGGIIAFAQGGEPVSTNPTDDYLAQFTDKKGNVDLNKAALSLLGQARPSSETDSAARQELLADIKDRREMRPYELLTRLGVGAMAGTSPNMITNYGQAGLNTMNAYGEDIKNEQRLKRELAKLDAEGAAKDDARRLQLAGTLLQIQGHKDIKAAALANAPSAADKNLTRAAALIGSDPVIKSLEKQQLASGAQPGTPEYDYYEKRIAERQNQIYTTVGVKIPEIGTSKIEYPKPEEKPGFFSSIFGGSKPEATKPKVVQFNQLPS